MKTRQTPYPVGWLANPASSCPPTSKWASRNWSIRPAPPTLPPPRHCRKCAGCIWGEPWSDPPVCPGFRAFSRCVGKISLQKTPLKPAEREKGHPYLNKQPDCPGWCCWRSFSLWRNGPLWWDAEGWWVKPHKCMSSRCPGRGRGRHATESRRPGRPVHEL